MAGDTVETPPGGRRRISAFSGAPVRQELEELLRLAGPVVLSRIGIMMMGLVDVIVVGHYSTRELGYHALGWAPTGVVLTASVGLIIGVQVMTARHIGEGRLEATGGVLRRGIVYAFLIGSAAAALLVVGGPPFLHAIGLEKDLADGASRALIVLAFSLPLQLVGNAAIFYLEALSRPKPATLAMWGANGINLALNLLLVPGVLGFPAMGAVGSCLATFGSRLILAAWVLIYIAKMPDARALGVFSKPIDGPEAAREQRRIGYGAGASYAVEAGAFNAMTLIAGWLGALVVAGWTVILNVAAIVFMVPLGLASATAVLVARAYGGGDKPGVIRAAVLGFGVCIVVLSLVAIVVWLGAPIIAAAYSNDPELIALAAAALGLASLFFVADGLQVVAAQCLRAAGEVWVPTFIHIAAYAGFMVPAGYILAITLGLELDGIVWAIILASILVAALQLARFWLVSRR